MSTFNYIRILNCLQAADKKMSAIDSVKGDAKFPMYAALFKNALAINLNIFAEPKLPEPVLEPVIVSDAVPEAEK